MAFGDGLRGGAGGEAGAVVKLVADTGEFNAKVEQAEREWRESVGQMSREALKLDLAQDRLKKSLAAYGAESQQAKRATIQLREAEEGAARAADRQARETRELDAAQDQAAASATRLGRSTRGIDDGYARARRSVIGYAGAYVGIHGLVGVIGSAIAAAKEEQNVLGQTRVALEAIGLSYDDHIATIERVIRAQSNLGFDDEALMGTFQLFVRSTKDVNAALELNALAVDVARGRYIDLEAAAQIVNKANLGMSGALRRIGLDVEKTATRTELLSTLTRNYGTAAEAASDDAVAAGDRLLVQWENMKELLASGLLPGITNYSDRLADWLGDAENQAEVQARVNEAMETGESVVRGLAGGFRFAKDALAPLVELVGGLENAIQIALVVGLVAKMRKAAASFGLIAAASQATTAKVVRDAAIAGRALDVAYRHRTFTVTGGGIGGVGGAAGKGGALGRIGSLVGLGPGGVIVAGGLAAGYFGLRSSQKDAVSGEEFGRIKKAAANGQITLAQLDALPDLVLTDSQERELRQIIANRLARRSAKGLEPGSGGADRAAGRKARAEREAREEADAAKPPAGKKPPTVLELELDVDRARDRGDEAAEVRALGRLRDRYDRQIRNLERRKTLTVKQQEELRRLYGAIAGVESQIDAIAEDNARERTEAAEASAAKREAAAKAAADKRKAAAAAEEKRVDELVESAMRQAERQRKKFAGLGELDTRAKLRAAALRGVDETIAGLKKKQAAGDDEKPMTAAEQRRGQFEFLTGLHGIGNQWGNNFQDSAGDFGLMATQAVAQTELLRVNAEQLGKLSGQVAHPEAKYAGNELFTAFGGVGF